MAGRKANWTRIVVALFALSFVYSSVCSTACAMGTCANQSRQAASHVCELPSPHSSNHTPDKPDCSGHMHPSALLVKSTDFPDIQWAGFDYLTVPNVFDSSADRYLAAVRDAEGSDLAPPFTQRIPLYQQISVLRI